MLRAWLNCVPKDAADRLGSLGYNEQDVTWFRARWARHVVIAAKMIVGAWIGVDSGSACPRALVAT